MRLRAAAACTFCVVWSGGVLCGLPGCHPGGGQRANLHAINPLDRARAVIRASEARDPASVHALIDLLDDADPAVRMYAIIALRRLCGRDYGYRYYESEGRRSAALERWRAAARNGELVVRAVPLGAEAPAELDAQSASGAAGGSGPPPRVWSP